MDKEIKETLNMIVGMIEDVGKKVDRLESEIQEMKIEMGLMKTEMKLMKTEMGLMKTEMGLMKTEQANMNEKLDALSSMYGRHEVAIQVLEKKRII